MSIFYEGDVHVHWGNLNADAKYEKILPWSLKNCNEWLGHVEDEECLYNATYLSIGAYDTNYGCMFFLEHLMLFFGTPVYVWKHVCSSWNTRVLNEKCKTCGVIMSIPGVHNSIVGIQNGTQNAC